MILMSVYNTKGGVGKTNMAVNISTACSMLGKKVAIIDTEENGTSSYVLQKQERKLFLDGLKITLLEKLNSLSVENITRVKYENKIKLIEGSLSLSIFSSSIEKASDNKALLKHIDKLKAEGYDLVVIDLPGKNVDNIIEIVNKSDVVLIPHRNTNLDFAGASKSIEKIKDLNKCKRVIWNERFGSIDEYEDLIEEMNIFEQYVKSLETNVKSSKSYDRAMNYGLGVVEMHEFLSEEVKSLFGLSKKLNKSQFKSSRDIIMSIIKELNI